MAERRRSTAVYHSFRDSNNFSHIQSLPKHAIQLVGVDRQYQEDDLGSLLQEIDSSSVSFDNVTSAIDYLTTNKDSKQFFVIVSGEFCEEMIQLSEHLPQIHYIFVYCLNLNLIEYEHLKGNSLKLFIICDKLSELRNAIEKAQQSPSIGIVRQYSMLNLSKESVTFIWFQLLKSLLTKLTTANEKTAINDLEEQIKVHHNNKEQREKVLRQLEVYDSKSPIEWYTQQTSFSDIINEALRQQDTDLLYKCRYFIRDLSKTLTNFIIIR